MFKGILPGADLFKARSHAPYQTLQYLQPGLMLDIGAAAGYTAGMMINMSPDSRVIAFEPFPGNHKFFEEHVQGDPRITLDVRAVSDKRGTATFNIPAMVAGSEPGWETMAGYSSQGLLSKGKAGRNSIVVETIAIDDIIQEPVRFLKIDTQGAEMPVLEGCRKLLAGQKIDMLLVEFDGDLEILNFLKHFGYTAIDTQFTLTNTKSVELPEWDILRYSGLSTGRQAAVGFPREHRYDADKYCSFLQSERERSGTLWTDMLFVSTPYFTRFIDGVVSLNARVPDDHNISMKDKIVPPQAV